MVWPAWILTQDGTEKVPRTRYGIAVEKQPKLFHTESNRNVQYHTVEKHLQGDIVENVGGQ